MVDSRHLSCTARSFKKIFVSYLGDGTQTYFFHDSNHKPGEPGGIIFVIGPKWGTSYAPQSSRSDYSGQGILASIRLRTCSSFIHLMGTYWPFVPPSALSAVVAFHLCSAGVCYEIYAQSFGRWFVCWVCLFDFCVTCNQISY